MSEAAIGSVECVVVGAGAIGLAIGRALAQAGREVLVLESETAFGTGISARSSEVIHAGMYYPEGSLKARLCVEGSAMLRRYLAARGIAHRLTGKLIIANGPDEERSLARLHERGRANGVADLAMIGRNAALSLEPSLRCTAALLSPSTGILDSHAYMLSLLADIEGAGGLLATASRVAAVGRQKDGYRLKIDGPETVRLDCRLLVNAAGLGAQGLALSIEGLDPALVPPLHLCKGNYFMLSGRQPFSRLIYPVPDRHGLGVHYTLDLGGQGRFGPDVEWTSLAGYDVSPLKGKGFVEAIRRYWPDLPDGALTPGYAGIRPKIVGPDDPPGDFLIQGSAMHGLSGLVNLFGLESPGLTASLAIAREVAELLS